MNRYSQLLPFLVLALMPAAVIADEFDDLDVTMEVLDSESEMTVLVKQMRGPDYGSVDRDLGREEDETAADSPFKENEFTKDDDFERDNLFRRQPLTQEDDFESLEGEDLNFDLPDPPDPDAY
jgi:hypothetical protein